MMQLLSKIIPMVSQKGWLLIIIPHVLEVN